MHGGSNLLESILHQLLRGLASMELLTLQITRESYNHINKQASLLGLNIFYSGIKYTEKDWVRHKVRHYPLLSSIFQTEQTETYSSQTEET